MKEALRAGYVIMQQVVPAVPSILILQPTIINHPHYRPSAQSFISLNGRHDIHYHGIPYLQRQGVVQVLCP